MFVALIIVVLASMLARAARGIVENVLGNLSYGRWIGRLTAGLILLIGIFAALDQLRIAPAIVNGLFYTGLAIVAGSAIVAIGGGGIVPMRAQWGKALKKMEEEAPKIRARARAASGEEKTPVWKRPIESSAPPRHPYARKNGPSSIASPGADLKARG